MTDQTPAPRTIAADKVQAVVDWLWNEEIANGGLDEEIAPTLAARAQMCWEVRAQLLALLRPTMADMTREERRTCKRMQADVKGEDSRVVIVNPYLLNGSARVMCQATRMRAVPWASIIPRPDLPRLEWPGDQKPEPEPEPAPALPGDWRLADHPDHGCVIVANPTPNRAGNVCFVMPAVDGDPRGFAWHLCSPNVLTYIDQEADQ